MMVLLHHRGRPSSRLDVDASRFKRAQAGCCARLGSLGAMLIT